MNAREQQISSAVGGVIRGLLAKGFTYPMQLVMTGLPGEVFVLRLGDREHDVTEELRIGKSLTIPIQIRVFSNAGHLLHTVTVVDDCKAHQKQPVQERMTIQ